MSRPLSLPLRPPGSPESSSRWVRACKGEARFPFLQKRNLGPWVAMSVHRSLRCHLAKGDLFRADSKSSIPQVCTLWGGSLRPGLRFKGGGTARTPSNVLMRLPTKVLPRVPTWREKKNTNPSVNKKVLCSKIKMALKTQKKIKLKI